MMLAPRGIMLPRLMIGLAAATAVLAALIAPKLMNRRTAAVIAEHSVAPTAVPPTERVVVQQQIVRAMETIETRRIQPVTVAVAAVPGARVSAKAPAATRATLLHRAARTLVGDGRHRPEPFPRAR
jgi:hypothetical protein